MSTRDVESLDLESVGSSRRRDGGQEAEEAENKEVTSSDILYDIDTAPPWHLAMVLGFQVSIHFPKT